MQVTFFLEDSHRSKSVLRSIVCKLLLFWKTLIETKSVLRSIVCELFLFWKTLIETTSILRSIVCKFFLFWRTLIDAKSVLSAVKLINPAYWVVLHTFWSSSDFFQNQFFFKQFSQDHHLSVKQFGSRPGLTFYRA